MKTRLPFPVTLAASIATLSLALCSPTLVRAASDSLEQARQAYREFEYDRVLPLLEQALREDPNDEERVEAYEMMANMHVMHGRRRQAQRAFAEILDLAPNYQLPAESSPKLRAAYEAAKREHIPLEAPAGQSPSGTDGRQETQPDEKLEPIDLDAQNQTSDDGDGTDEDEPEKLDREEMLVRKLVRERSPFYETWWFWTAVGVVAVGAAAGAWFATHPPPPDHQFGPIPVSGP